MATRFQLRRDDAANWTSVDPVLLDGEMAVERDTGKFKVGDGTTAWTGLAYSSGIQGVAGADGATILTGSVDPTTEGVDGDLYINITSYDLFKKVAGTWSNIGNIKGATGDTGATGVGVPSGGMEGQIIVMGSSTTEWQNQVRAISFYIDGDLTVDTDLMSIISPMSLTITEIRCAVSTAPTDADLIIDINKNGTTIYTTQANRPTILATETTETATDPDITTLAVGDILSLDIDQIGSTVAGANLSVIIICEV